MGTFTSWSALKTQILNDLASGKALTSGYSIGGHSINFRSFTEIRSFLEYCDMQIKAEGGLSGGTAYAKFERPGATDEDD